MIRKYYDSREVVQRRKKWSIFLNIEKKTKKWDPSFVGFYLQENNGVKRIELMIHNFESI